MMSLQMSVQPTEVHLKQAESVLEITWSDGHRFAYALRYLRGWCPCAHCQGHFAEQKTFVQVGEVALRDVEPVGGYAVSFRWADGHHTGIYTFNYLLELERTPPGDGPTNADCLRGAMV
jgi:DUF971 family protein